MANDVLNMLNDLLTKAMKKGADAGDAVHVISTSLSVAQRLGKPEKLERSENSDIGIRVFAGKRQAIVSMFEDWYPTWGKLFDAVVTGKPPVQKPHDQGDEATRTYIYGMHYRGLAQAQLLARKIPLKGRKRLVDIAGGPGTFSIMLCKANKGLSATVIDRPQTLRVTREIIASYGVNDRVATKEGDYLADTFGAGYDAGLLSSMFNQESPTVVKDILRKTHDALAPGGLVIVQEQLLNDEKSGPALAAMIGVNQLLHTPGGAAYSGREMGDWMKEVGFTKVKRVPMPSPSPFIVLTGIKP